MSKPSDKEEEYFKSLEIKKAKKAADETKNKKLTALGQQIKSLQELPCPQCGIELQQKNYKDFKIAVCQNCQGIWLPGESVKILD